MDKTKLEFFDVNVWIGKPTKKFLEISLSVDELIKKMDSLKIKKAVVWHIAQQDAGPIVGNEILYEKIAEKPRLFGIWPILPPQTNEIKSGNFFINMKKNRIIGVKPFPKKHNFLLNSVTFGDFLSKLEERRIPLFLDILSNQCVDFKDVYEIMKDFPYLTSILCNIGLWNTDRYTWPLLEKFPNFYLESSLLSLQEGGIEATVKRFGGAKIVFGTGFPERYMESSILQITHAEISDEDKRKIAFENLENLIKKIRYE